MYRLNQKPVYFLSAQMALVSTFFQMFKVLGMYNFGFTETIYIFSVFVLASIKYSQSQEHFTKPPSKIAANRQNFLALFMATIGLTIRGVDCFLNRGRGLAVV